MAVLCKTHITLVNSIIFACLRGQKGLQKKKKKKYMTDEHVVRNWNLNETIIARGNR